MFTKPLNYFLEKLFLLLVKLTFTFYARLHGISVIIIVAIKTRAIENKSNNITTACKCLSIDVFNEDPNTRWISRLGQRQKRHAHCWCCYHQSIWKTARICIDATCRMHMYMLYQLYYIKYIYLIQWKSITPHYASSQYRNDLHSKLDSA